MAAEKMLGHAVDPLNPQLHCANPGRRRLMSASGPRFLLTVLGGFLGAGKTTWLRHHLHSGVFRDAIVIVNEAASAPVDHVLLSSADRIHVLAGGCACCEGKSELLRLLRDLSASTRIGETSEIQRIVLETSGLADPQSILVAIASDPELSRCIEVTEVVVIVDAVNGLELLRDEALARRQIACADCLIVAKTDAVESHDVVRLLNALQSLNPLRSISAQCAALRRRSPMSMAAISERSAHPRATKTPVRSSLRKSASATPRGPCSQCGYRRCCTRTAISFCASKELFARRPAGC